MHNAEPQERHKDNTCKKANNKGRQSSLFANTKDCRSKKGLFLTFLYSIDKQQLTSAYHLSQQFFGIVAIPTSHLSHCERQPIARRNLIYGKEKLYIRRDNSSLIAEKGSTKSHAKHIPPAIAG